MKTPSLIAGALVAASQFTGALGQNIRGEQKAIQVPVPGSLTVQGCWSSKGNMTESEVEPAAVSSGSCNRWCIKEKYTVFALSGQICYCGMVMPPEDTLVKDLKKCKYECPGWPFEACGGIGTPTYYSVFNMGVNVNPSNYEEEEKTSTTSSAKPTETTATENESRTSAAAETSAPATTSSADPSGDDNKDNGGGPNVAGIVAGVVSGIVVVAASCFGLWFYMRRKRNNEIEEEHRRNAAVNAFISGSKPPSSSGSISMTDSRLDPVMAHRRLSDGSIADNEDYSRKILRVSRQSGIIFTTMKLTLGSGHQCISSVQRHDERHSFYPTTYLKHV